MKLTDAIRFLKPLQLDRGRAESGLREYELLASQAAVLSKLLPDLRKDGTLLEPDRRGGRRMQRKLLEKLRDLLPVDEGALESWEEMQEEEEGAGLLAEIPFRSCYPHDGDLDPMDVQEMPEGERLATMIHLGATGPELAEEFDLAEVPKLGALNYATVVENLMKEPAPVSYLADAFRILARDTRNFWWDGICMCGGACGCGLPWDTETIDVIASQKKEAEEIGEHLALLTKWIRKDPKTRVRRLLSAMEGRTS